MMRRIQPLSLILFAADVMIVPLGLWSSSVLRAALPIGRGGALPEAATQIPPILYLVSMLAWSISLAASKAYDPQVVLRWYNEALRVIWGALVATFVLAGVLYFTFRELSRLQYIYFLVVNLSLMLGFRAAFRIYYRIMGRTRPGLRSRILILGAGEVGRRVAGVLLDHSRWGFDLVGFLDDDARLRAQSLSGVPVLGGLERLKEVVAGKDVKEVWVTLPARAYDRVQDIVDQLEREPVRIKIVPDYFSLALIRAETEVFGGIPIIGLREPAIEGVPRLVKRAFDLAIASLSLLAFGPLMIVLAILIRLESAGSALFVQTRVGENGRLFRMLKFRTMVEQESQFSEDEAADPETEDVIHKRRDDPRTTRLGRLLRRLSLDELPQLINVVRGEMSLVGPRPELPWLVDRYQPWQRARFAVPQGLTGWWQINGRSDRPMHLYTEDDLYYVYNYSLWLDIFILLRTPWVVLQGKGAF